MFTTSLECIETPPELRVMKLIIVKSPFLSAKHDCIHRLTLLCCRVAKYFLRYKRKTFSTYDKALEQNNE